MLAQQQRTYLEAKAKYEGLIEQLAAILGDPPEDESDLDDYIEREELARAELGMRQAQLDMQEAERALYEWGIAIVRRQPRYKAHQAELEALFTSKIIRFRDKTIGLFLQLDASTAYK